MYEREKNIRLDPKSLECNVWSEKRKLFTCASKFMINICEKINRWSICVCFSGSVQRTICSSNLTFPCEWWVVSSWIVFRIMMESMHFINETNISVTSNPGSDKHYLIKQFTYNRNIDEPYYSLLIALYSFLIIFGSTGNILVVLAVLRNKQMQTARWEY